MGALFCLVSAIDIENYLHLKTYITISYYLFFSLSLSIDGFISEPGASPQVSTIPQIAVSLALQPKLSQVPSVVRRRRANGENLMASALGGLRYL